MRNSGMKLVDEDTKLRMKRGERLPRAGHEGLKEVGESTWDKHGERKDTAIGRIFDDEPPVE